MFRSRSHSLIISPVARTLVVLVVAAGLLATSVATGYAAPSATSTPSAIQSKQEEEAATRRLLEQMRLDLEVKVAEYIELGKEIEQTKVEVSEVTTELARMEVELDAAEQALAQRAVELYRGDRVDMLQLLLSAQTLQDLWVRSAYLAKISFRDVRLIDEVRLARSENLWLKEGLHKKVERLAALQIDADAQRSQIETDIALQTERAAQLKVDLARLMWTPVSGSSVSEDGFNPDTVIAEAVFRDSGSMSAEQIQAFLDEQSGSLDTYTARDHNGQVRTVAQMVAEAAQGWGVNPKVILATLQKEQSLLSRANPTKTAYDWAMGCGRADSRTFYQYKGFGKQIWFGAEKLAKNGGAWKPGKTMKIDGSTIHPTNAATYSLFKYTPHFRGTMSFWLIYWRYFGDPVG